MNRPNINKFFSLCIIDISKLKNINVKDFLELRDPPEYYLVISPLPLYTELLIQNIPENYRVQAVGERFYIASHIGGKDYHIPEAKYTLVKITRKVSGIILNIWNTGVLYINLEESNGPERQQVNTEIQKLAISHFQIDIICIQSYHQNNQLHIHNWHYFRPRPDYPLNVLENYHILTNQLNNPLKFRQLSAEGNIYQSGNYGTTLYIPNWLEYLKECLKLETSPNKYKTP